MSYTDAVGNFLGVHGVAFTFTLFILSVFVTAFNEEIRLVLVLIPSKYLKAMLRRQVGRDIQTVQRIQGSSYELVLFFLERSLRVLIEVIYGFSVAFFIYRYAPNVLHLRHIERLPMATALYILTIEAVDMRRTILKLRWSPEHLDNMRKSLDD